MKSSAVAAICLSLGVALSASAQAETISLMVGGIGKQIYLPAKLAERLGYFAEAGLDVQLLDEPAGVEAEDELLAGAVQGVIGFYDHCVDLQAKGKFVESVVQLARAPGEVEMVSASHPEIRSAADFKGRAIGVTGLGSSTHFLTLYFMVKAGLKLSDAVIAPVDAGDTFIAAIRTDAIQAGMTTEPTVSRLMKLKLAIPLIDLRTEEATRAALGGAYPGASLYMETSYVDAHRDAVHKLVGAFVKALKYIDAHDPAEIANSMPRDFFVDDRELYVKGLAEDKAMFTRDGRMPEGGPATVLAVLSAFSESVRGKTIDLSRTYTNEFVDRAR